MAKKALKVVIVNPEAIEGASKRFTEIAYTEYMKSLIIE
jgi:hypothetical protein